LFVKLDKWSISLLHFGIEFQQYVVTVEHLLPYGYLSTSLAFTNFNLVICNARGLLRLLALSYIVFSVEQLVESVLNKVVEEFEHRIASQGEQVQYHFTLLMYNVIVFR